MFGPVFVFGFRVVWGVSLWPRGCSGLFFCWGLGFRPVFVLPRGFSAWFLFRFLPLRCGRRTPRRASNLNTGLGRVAGEIYGRVLGAHGGVRVMKAERFMFPGFVFVPGAGGTTPSEDVNESMVLLVILGRFCY